MGMIPISAQIVCILQFLVLMLLLAPLMNICSSTGACIIPKAYASSFNSLANTTAIQFTNKIQSPLISNASSSSGFGANVAASGFGGLAFIYGALGEAWSSIVLFPTMLLTIFNSLGSGISFIPALGVVASLGIVSYVVLSDFFIVLSWIMKTDAANIGQ